MRDDALRREPVQVAATDSVSTKPACSAANLVSGQLMVETGW
jgi:hypothetical protein